ncbi:MAG: enolase C-terminal domain-like protein [Phycisphaerales bacterium JB039]
MDGSDAMHRDPDYSAAYVTLRTDQAGLEGHGLTFTIGRGNEVCVAACRALAPMVVGRQASAIRRDMRGFWRTLASDTQLRWIGPEKGVIHLATAAVVNAVWDLLAKLAGKPLWMLISEMPAEELVACMDFRYLSDAITEDAALELLRSDADRQADRIARMRAEGFPAYTTSAGWLGYSDEKISRLCRAGIEAGWTHFKIKVGADLQDDIRRAGVVRSVIGPQRRLMMDANQRWDVGEAIENMRALARFDPWWIEEPTSPDDVLGHAAIARAIAPIGVATGEQCQNRVMFKQFMQAGAIRFCQLDACRLGGVNECLAVMLLARRFGVPICPHAGGVGLCELVNHLCMIDYVRFAGSTDDRVCEYVDHLHEHFEHPCVVREGRYRAPEAPGYSATIKPATLARYRYPDGDAWRRRLGREGR